MQVAHYSEWSELPPTYLTYSALRRRGLRPGGSPIATFTHRGWVQTVLLYDVNRARSKHDPTLVQVERESKAERQQLLKAAQAYWDGHRRQHVAEALNTSHRRAATEVQRWWSDPTTVILAFHVRNQDGQIDEVAVCDRYGHILLAAEVGVEISRLTGVSQSKYTWGDLWLQLEAVLSNRRVVTLDGPSDVKLLTRTLIPVLPAERIATIAVALPDGGTRITSPRPLLASHWLGEAASMMYGEFQPRLGYCRYLSLAESLQVFGAQRAVQSGALGQAMSALELLSTLARWRWEPWSPEALPAAWVAPGTYRGTGVRYLYL